MRRFGLLRQVDWRDADKTKMINVHDKTWGHYLKSID